MGQIFRSFIHIFSRLTLFRSSAADVVPFPVHFVLFYHPGLLPDSKDKLDRRTRLEVDILAWSFDETSSVLCYAILICINECEPNDN